MPKKLMESMTKEQEEYMLKTLGEAAKSSKALQSAPGKKGVFDMVGKSNFVAMAEKKSVLPKDLSKEKREKILEHLGNAAKSSVALQEQEGRKGVFSNIPEAGVEVSFKPSELNPKRVSPKSLSPTGVASFNFDEVNYSNVATPSKEKPKSQGRF